MTLRLESLGYNNSCQEKQEANKAASAAIPLGHLIMVVSLLFGVVLFEQAGFLQRGTINVAWLTDCGSWQMLHGSWLVVHGSWLMAHALTWPRPGHRGAPSLPQAVPAPARAGAMEP